MSTSTTRPQARRALFGATYLALLATVVGLLVAQSQGAFRDTVVVTTNLESVGDGLPVGSDVKMRGIIVGRVSQVQSSLEVKTVTLEIKPEFAEEIPAAVHTRILPVNVFGAPFVDLRVTGPERPAIEPGMALPEDRSEESVQMQTVFQKVYDVLVAVEPAKLNLTLTVIADALRGNGERIGQMIERSEAYLSRLNPNAARFKRDLRLLASTLEGFQAATPDLLAAMDNVSATARLLVHTQNDLRALLAAGVDGAETVGGFLDENGRRLVRFFSSAAELSSILAPVSPGIQSSLVALGHLAGRLVTAMPGRSGVRVKVILTPSRFPTYTWEDCPRYPGLAGPNCRGSRGRETQGAGAATYGGSVGSVGSAEEQRILGGILDDEDPDATGDLGSLLLGPAMRPRAEGE